MSKVNNVTKFPTAGNQDDFPDEENLYKLAKLLKKYAPHDDRFDLNVEGLHVLRASKTTHEKTYSLAQPGMCIVAQGAKSVSLTNNYFNYDHSNMVVYAAEVPLNVKVVEASKEKPYLCLVIPIDPHKMAELILKIFPHGVPKKSDVRPIYVGKSNPNIVKSAIRLMEIILNQEDVDLLVPLVIDEILIRLLRSPIGASIAQIGILDSNTYKVSKAISWLKSYYNQAVKIEDLAKIAGMSLSPFHTHFKKLTLMSPLQYQKALRLEEARNLLVARIMDVTNTSFHVGYSSVSQFSREYSRYFGKSPIQDLARSY
ncbi:AraC family transcriptional regulator [Legionella bozemanae]|uniref:AraC family transcriptional regulator n=1 Tax=Legionella bozemanae TaxID=447 RepID=UPI00399C76A4